MKIIPIIILLALSFNVMGQNKAKKTNKLTANSKAKVYLDTISRNGLIMFSSDDKPYLTFKNNGEIVYKDRVLMTDSAIVIMFKD